MRLRAPLNLNLDPLLMYTKNWSQQSAGCCGWQPASDLSISYHLFNRPLYKYLLPCRLLGTDVVQHQTVGFRMSIFKSCSNNKLQLFYYYS